MTSSTENGYIVGPVLKALHVLDAIVAKGHPVSLTMIADELKLPKTSVFRYLRTLCASGFLSYDAMSDRYCTGNRFRTLASADDKIRRLLDEASPILADMNREFNETINLAVLSGHEIVYIAIRESSRGLRMQARVGRRDPLHSTALGKAILARLPVEERTRLLSSALSQRTLRTMTQLKAVLRQLQDVEASGFAVEIGENEEGAMCIGTAILAQDGSPIAAISLSAPERRMTSDVRARSILRLQSASADIAAALN